MYMFFCYFSSEDGLLEFSYTVKVPLEVLNNYNASYRTYKYHVESPLTRKGVILSLEFIAGFDAGGALIDRCLKLHVQLDSLKNQCKFMLCSMFM